MPHLAGHSGCPTKALSGSAAHQRPGSMHATCCSPAASHLHAAQQLDEGGAGRLVAAPDLPQQRLAKHGMQRAVGWRVAGIGAQIDAAQRAQGHIVRPCWLHGAQPGCSSWRAGSKMRLGGGGGGGGRCSSLIGQRWDAGIGCLRFSPCYKPRLAARRGRRRPQSKFPTAREVQSSSAALQLRPMTVIFIVECDRASPWPPCIKCKCCSAIPAVCEEHVHCTQQQGDQPLDKGCRQRWPAAREQAHSAMALACASRAPCPNKWPAARTAATPAGELRHGNGGKSGVGVGGERHRSAAWAIKCSTLPLYCSEPGHEMSTCLLSPPADHTARLCHVRKPDHVHVHLPLALTFRPHRPTEAARHSAAPSSKQRQQQRRSPGAGAAAARQAGHAGGL